ncbi:MAG: right-handed parallel beta-helix repeat-containing protein [Acidobacteria bacterium]|nr:right-handed parallel beta-helix repeat-containing protein [Acidobacteriota bacterium]
MTEPKFTLQAAALFVFTLAFTSLAQAQATRTWVSGVGDDVNPCSRTAPCKTWAGAISKTAAGGEIDALDPGGFGTLTITKSLLVDGTNGQGFGSTLNSGGINGFVINDSLTATPGTSLVRLRNLSINGAGTTAGLNGIRFLSGKALHVENCRIMNQSSNGIEVNNATQFMEVFITDTIVSNVTGSGFLMNNGNAQAQISNSSFNDNGTGISNTTGLVNVTNSIVAGNSTGITGTTGGALTHISGCSVNNNSVTGINASGGALTRISDNDVFRNGTGLNNSSTMETYRNNRVRGNTAANLSGVLTDISAVGTGIQ